MLEALITGSYYFIVIIIGFFVLKVLLSDITSKQKLILSSIAICFSIILKYFTSLFLDW